MKIFILSLALLSNSLFAEHGEFTDVYQPESPSPEITDLINQGFDEAQCQRVFAGDMTGIDPRVHNGLFRPLAYSGEKEKEIADKRWSVIKNCIAQIARKEAEQVGCKCNK